MGAESHPFVDGVDVIQLATSGAAIDVLRGPALETLLAWSERSRAIGASAHMKQNLERNILALKDGVKLAYFEAGRGPDLLLIHGALATSHDMKISLMGVLAETYHVIAFDRPGHGASTRPRLAGSPYRQAKLILEGCRALGLKRPLVIGHSLGATVAVEMALSWPDYFSGIVAIAPIAFPEPRLETVLFGPRATFGLGDWAVKELDGGGLDGALLLLLWPAMFLPQRMPAAFRDGMAFNEVRSGPGLLANGEDAVATIPALARNSMRYATCRVPIEIINGDRDIVVNPWIHARPLARLLPNGSCTIVPGRGHMVHHFEADLIIGKAEEARRHVDLAVV